MFMIINLAIYPCLYMFMIIHLNICIVTLLHTPVCMCVFKCLDVHVCVCMCVCVCVCVCVYTQESPLSVKCWQMEWSVSWSLWEHESVSSLPVGGVRVRRSE